MTPTFENEFIYNSSKCQLDIVFAISWIKVKLNGSNAQNCLSLKFDLRGVQVATMAHEGVSLGLFSSTTNFI